MYDVSISSRYTQTVILLIYDQYTCMTNLQPLRLTYFRRRLVYCVVHFVTLFMRPTFG